MPLYAPSGEKSYSPVESDAEDPRTVAHIGLCGLVYGKHPLGRNMLGTPESVRRIGPEPYIQAEMKFPNARRGPVYHLKALPDGFEPHWTYADIGGAAGK